MFQKKNLENFNIYFSEELKESTKERQVFLNFKITQCGMEEFLIATVYSIPPS